MQNRVSGVPPFIKQRQERVCLRTCGYSVLQTDSSGRVGQKLMEVIMLRGTGSESPTPFFKVDYKQTDEPFSKLTTYIEKMVLPSYAKIIQ